MPDEKISEAPTDPFFGEPISVYTTEQAIEDGVLFDAGRIFNRSVVVTANLIHTLTKPEIIAALIAGLFRASHNQEPDIVGYTIGDHKLFVDDNGETITVMLAEDY